LYQVATRGLPDFQPKPTVYVRTDSGIVSSASLPALDSVAFVLLDSAAAQQLANKLGSVNVIGVERPMIQDDTARMAATSRYVLRQSRIGGMVSMSACAFRARRTDGKWQVDSTLGCIIT
jgi:hypothetical protein